MNAKTARGKMTKDPKATPAKANITMHLGMIPPNMATSQTDGLATPAMRPTPTTSKSALVNLYFRTLQPHPPHLFNMKADHKQQDTAPVPSQDNHDEQL